MNAVMCFALSFGSLVAIVAPSSGLRSQPAQQVEQIDVEVGDKLVRIYTVDGYFGKTAFVTEDAEGKPQEEEFKLAVLQRVDGVFVKYYAIFPDREVLLTDDLDSELHKVVLGILRANHSNKRMPLSSIMKVIIPLFIVVFVAGVLATLFVLSRIVKRRATQREVSKK